MTNADAAFRGRRAAVPGGVALHRSGLAFAAAALSVAALLLAIPVSRQETELFSLVALAGFAVLGVFFLMAAASGLIRAGASTSGAAEAALQGVESGVLVTDWNGDPIYENGHELARLLGRALGGLGDFARGDDHAKDPPLFRLAQAAARGEHRQEQVVFGVDGARRILRVDVRPLRASPGAPAQSILWHACDMTKDHMRHGEAVDRLAATIAGYDAAPVGLLTTARDGSVTHVNATLARWLGTESQTIAERDLKLDDLLSSDGVQLLSAWSRHSPSAGIDLELTKEDGGLLPVRLLARCDDDGHALAVINYEEDPARRDDMLAEVRFARFFRSSPFGIATAGPDGKLIGANAAFSRMMLDGEAGAGERVDELLARNVNDAERELIEAGLKQVLSGRGKVAPIDLALGPGDGQARRVYMSPVPGSRRSREAAVIYTIDSSEQKALEAKLAQSQKMDAVGKLAGGIAHDFNNVLTVIIGYSDLLLQKHRQTDPAFQEIVNIKSSANRAASLVGKLLAFSRQQTMQPEALRIEEVLGDLAPFLKRAIGEKVELDMPAARDVWSVKADRTQIDHVFINLAVNARDAMPEGGKIAIRIRNVGERESLRLGKSGLAVGEYVLIEVGDTGVGMPPEVVEKIFEPFFTTKAVGKGTGLGLATVYGIVKQTGGFILADSEVGKGTTFRIYLPRCESEADEDAPAAPPQAAAKPAVKKETPSDLTGAGRLLLVEDEDMVRGFAVRALKSRGYEVLEASTGAEALEMLDRAGGDIDLVISDVVMPEMDGPTLLKELRKKRPNLKIVFVSGYPNEAFKASLGDADFAFLPKPFSLPQLAAKVKEMLG